MFELLSHLFRTLRKMSIRQLTNKFVTDFNRLILDLQQCLSFSE